MSALFRYLWTISVREGWLAALLIGPALLILSPYLLMTIVDVIQGKAVWPIVMNGSAAAGWDGMVDALIIVSAVGACACAFNAFAREASSGALGSLLLAAKPEVIVATAVCFAFVTTVAGYAIGRVAVELVGLTMSGWSTAPFWNEFPKIAAQVVLLFACGASAGMAALAIAPMPTMLIPAVAVVMVDVVLLLKRLDAIRVAGALLEIVVLMAVAVWFVRRRCAA